MKKIIKTLHDDLYLEVICFIFFVLSFCFEPIIDVFNGYLKILTSPSILLTDYIYVGGLGATFFNVATNLLFNLLIVRLAKIKISGPVYCGIFMIIGYSFFGKNILNSLPIYLGIFLFSKYKHIHFKSMAITFLFSNGLSPLVSYSIFGFGLPLYFGIPLGIVVGLIVGFILPAFAAHTMTFHEGYSIYNIGFALGVLSTIFHGIFIFFELDVNPLKLYDGNHSNVLYIFLLVFLLLNIVIAFIGDKKVFKKYKNLCKTSGRLISDYVREFSVEAVMLNIGIIGSFITLLLFVYGVELNGILFGSILSILGLAGFGCHIINCLPVWIGSIIMIVIKMALRGNFSIVMEEDISILVALIFVIGLAPIGGKYGIKYGLIAGMLHITFVPLFLAFQGGFSLYNNGFACGFEASVLAIVAEKISNRERIGSYAKQRKN